MIRGLCWPPLLSLAVQKGTNWQWANESPLSLSGAQLPPQRSGPPFPLPLLCLPSFIYSPPPLLFSLLHISCPPHFLLFLPATEPSAAPRPAPPLWIAGWQRQTRARNRAAIRLTEPAPPMRSAYLILTTGTCAAALSPRSFRLMRRGRQEITSGGTRVAPRISNAGAGSF